MLNVHDSQTDVFERRLTNPAVMRASSFAAKTPATGTDPAVNLSGSRKVSPSPAPQRRGSKMGSMLKYGKRSSGSAAQTMVNVLAYEKEAKPADPAPIPLASPPSDVVGSSPVWVATSARSVRMRESNRGASAVESRQESSFVTDSVNTAARNSTGPESFLGSRIDAPLIIEPQANNVDYSASVGQGKRRHILPPTLPENKG